MLVATTDSRVSVQMRTVSLEVITNLATYLLEAHPCVIINGAYMRRTYIAKNLDLTKRSLLQEDQSKLYLHLKQTSNKTFIATTINNYYFYVK